MSSASSPLFAQIIVLVGAPHLSQPFTYGVTEDTNLAPGDCVLVPFGSRDTIGYVVALSEDCPPEIFSKVRPIAGKIEDAAGFDSHMWKLAQWVSAQTLCDIESAVRLIAPDITSARLKTVVHLLDLNATPLSFTGESAEIVSRLQNAASHSLRLAEIGKSAQISRALSSLRRSGVIERVVTVDNPSTRHKTVRLVSLLVPKDQALIEADKLALSRAHRQAKLLRELAENETTTESGIPQAGGAVDPTLRSAAQALASKGLISYFEVKVNRDPFGMRALQSTNAPSLNDEQSAAASQIRVAVQSNSHHAFLIHGVTGSGKTEVYMNAIAAALAMKKSALFLLPEISLSAQVMDILKARFGDDVAVLHSALSPGQWFDEWQRIRRGEAHVVVGARSAVFAPAQNLGLIVVDEEHDGSYKQDTNPRYNAREVALRRARELNAVCVLGSATPSIESRYHASEGTYTLLKLTKRIGERTLPPVNTVDLRLAVKGTHPGVAALLPHLRGILSPALVDAMQLRLERKEQSILFLNRRGFAKFLLCRDCGFTFQCKDCAVALTYHREAAILQCHHCGFTRPAPEKCPKCSGTTLRPFGIGTEKVQEAVDGAFEGVRTLRMDRDTVTRKGAHGEILRAFKSQQADVLIGTQMVAKGLDFPNVTLVGVINADTALNLPDFRASERAFQLVMQVAGRAGRGDTKGEVIVQTFNPDHESVKMAAAHDYDSFYNYEIENRRELCYPPFSYLANLVVSHEDDRQALEIAAILERKLKNAITPIPTDAQPTVLGPVACPLERLRNKFRHHIVLRTPNRIALLRVVKTSTEALTQQQRACVAVDIDPTTML